MAIANVFKRDAEARRYARINIGKPEVVVAKDHVIICGQVVTRPASIAPSQWLEYWERLQ